MKDLQKHIFLSYELLKTNTFCCDDDEQDEDEQDEVRTANEPKNHQLCLHITSAKHSYEAKSCTHFFHNICINIMYMLHVARQVTVCGFTKILFFHNKMSNAITNILAFESA